MPNRRKRARMRRGGIGSLLVALIVLFSAVAGALVFLLLQSGFFAPQADGALSYAYDANLQFVEADATPAPLVLGASASPEPSPETSGDATTDDASEADASVDGTSVDGASTDGTSIAGGADAIPESSDASTASQASGNRLMPTPPPGDFFLPVIDRALRTPDDPAMIAVTVDGCDDPVKLTVLLNTASRYGAQLTLFPTGDALMNMPTGFRTCVNSLGCELENATFDANRKDYSLSDGELALQLWRQSVAASYAVGRDYQQHFYRCSLPQSAFDQRTHFFIRKLGLLGVVSYTYSYKGSNLNDLVDSLANGNIYQFDLSDESMALFESFLSAANRKGYKLATLNELLGLEANPQGEALTLDQQVLPSIDDYAPTYYDLKLNDRTNAVYALQGRLIALGYLKGQPGETLVADGIYGSDTSIAVSAFQARAGLIATGNADVATQEKLFAADAPPAQTVEPAGSAG